MVSRSSNSLVCVKGTVDFFAVIVLFALLLLKKIILKVLSCHKPLHSPKVCVASGTISFAQTSVSIDMVLSTQLIMSK